MLIALDAGHGGSDPGAVYNGRREKDDNLKLAMAVGDILKNEGMDVFYTRDNDIYETPLKRQLMPIIQERIILYHFTEIQERIPTPQAECRC